ncbi:MAG: hypothetical protein QGD94_11195, partial [Planctomycetia bacterium]|nr:hypothetical protein [Planctomycetia bacterium]
AEDIQEHPKAELWLVPLTKAIEKLRENLCGAVDSVVYSNAAAGLLAGLGSPVLLLIILKLCFWLSSRPGNQKGETDASPPAAPHFSTPSNGRA